MSFEIRGSYFGIPTGKWNPVPSERSTYRICIPDTLKTRSEIETYPIGNPPTLLVTSRRYKSSEFFGDRKLTVVKTLKPDSKRKIRVKTGGFGCRTLFRATRIQK